LGDRNGSQGVDLGLRGLRGQQARGRRRGYAEQSGHHRRLMRVPAQPSTPWNEEARLRP